MGPPELIIVGIIAIAVIFGAKKLPEIAHNLGRSSNEFKKGLKEGGEEADAPAAQPTPPTQAAPPPAQPTQAATPTETTEQPKPEA
ncbi:MAG TPA: twin-arginine translocase TatA/TatE family subunit [Actinomycetota bacterium]|jgi:sec-independent protein translocase protein TatA|nr:twin-arginine translocase TatA/TatE family subunit [Actinomycetota bacterium]